MKRGGKLLKPQQKHLFNLFLQYYLDGTHAYLSSRPVCCQSLNLGLLTLMSVLCVLFNCPLWKKKFTHPWKYQTTQEKQSCAPEPLMLQHQWLTPSTLQKHLLRVKNHPLHSTLAHCSTLEILLPFPSALHCALPFFPFCLCFKKQI